MLENIINIHLRKAWLIGLAAAGLYGCNDTTGGSRTNFSLADSSNISIDNFTQEDLTVNTGDYLGYDFSSEKGIDTILKQEDLLEIVADTCPSIVSLGKKMAIVNEVLTFNVSDGNDNFLKYTAQNLPAQATFDVQAQIFTWAPQCGQEGIYMLTFSTDDGVCVKEKEVILDVVTPPVTCFAKEFTKESAIGFIENF